MISKRWEVHVMNAGSVAIGLTTGLWITDRLTSFLTCCACILLWVGGFALFWWIRWLRAKCAAFDEVYAATQDRIRRGAKRV